MQFEVSNGCCEPMCSAIVMYSLISGGQTVQPCPQGTPLGHWEGREQSWERGCGQHLFPSAKQKERKQWHLFPSAKRLEQIVNTSDEIMT